MAPRSFALSIVMIAMGVAFATSAASATSVVLLQDDFENGLSSWQISAPPPNQVLVHDVALNDGFEGSLGAWTLTGNAMTTSSPVFEGGSALLLDYQGDYTSASRDFSSATNLRARVYFYDDGDTSLGTVFQLTGSGSQINCGSETAPYWVQPNTALGVKTDLGAQYYVVRINCPVGTSNGMFLAEERVPSSATVSPVRRRTGWHLFELLVTSQGTCARIDDREITRSNPYQTDGTSVAFGATWGLTGRAVYDALSIEGGYQSGKSLLLNYSDPNGPSENAVVATRAIASAQNVLFRTFFFDTMDPSLGTMAVVKDSSGAWQTGLGVSTQITSSAYAIRINSASQMYDTGIRRSAGWHMFEIIVTDRGAYAKIDNQLIARSNPGHTSAASISYVSTWGLSGALGQALYDDLLVIAADSAAWQDQLYSPLRTHYQKYSALIPPDNATVFSPLYSQLGLGLNSNDLRAVMGSAIAWYLYGQEYGDASAKALGKRVFLEGWANAPWKRGQDVDDWARGASMGVVVYAAHVLWNELDQPTRDQVIQELYVQASTYANRLPESGYIGDTKAEENAWHAAFLASVVNLFPNAPGYDKEWIETKARCFAYHSITRSALYDGPYCGLSTQTVYDDWVLENHGQINPSYSSGVIDQLSRAAFSYRIAGRPIPWEFTHNVQPLFNKYMTYVDLNSYAYVNAPPDWDGAHNSSFISPAVFRYLDVLGVPTGLSWQDYMSKRSVFYYDISSSWLKKIPPYLRIREWNQSDKPEDSYRFFLDSVDAGEFYGIATRSLSLPLVCEEGLFKEKAWAGALSWSCDRAIHSGGNTSVQLSTSVDSNVEAYSPLMPVNGNSVYKVSYGVMTKDLAAAGAQPATILGRVIAAQYTSAAQEIDPVNASNRIDAGLSLGVNQSGTTGWTNRSYDIATTSTAFIRLRGVLAGNGTGKGTAWFDNITLTPLSKVAVPTSNVVASSYDPPTPPANAVDGDLSTRWSAQGDGQWIRLDLGTVRDVSAVRIAFYFGDQQKASFDIQTSSDGGVWMPVFSGSSSGTSTRLQLFDSIDSSARYVRIVGHGNSQDDWNRFAAIEVWGRGAD